MSHPTMPSRVRTDLVIGTRPNIVKAAPLFAELMASKWCDPRIVFLMQHTDAALAVEPLNDLGVPSDQTINIPLSKRAYGERLGEMLHGYAEHLSSQPPDLVLVFGDVDTTLAAAYAAKRAVIPLAHVEAGLRSGDMSMPEELNRRMVDSISDIHFTTTLEASDILSKEGQSSRNIHFVGNLMIDALKSVVDREHGQTLCRTFSIAPGNFALATFHRPSNVDSSDQLEDVLSMLCEVAKRIPVLFPIHPRTRVALERFGLSDHIKMINGLHTTPPLRYRDFISLLSVARLALTDSGGIQEETSFLGVPCITVRENTERPVTISHGSNRLASPESAALVLEEILESPMPKPSSIPRWDGETSRRISSALKHLSSRTAEGWAFCGHPPT